MIGKRKKIRRQLKTNVSSNPKLLSSCYGKIRHNSYEAAKVANEKKINFVRPYKCQFCPYYHVGRRKQ